MGTDSGVLPAAFVRMCAVLLTGVGTPLPDRGGHSVAREEDAGPSWRSALYIHGSPKSLYTLGLAACHWAKFDRGCWTAPNVC